MEEEQHETWLRVKARIAQMPKGAGREEAWLASALKTSASRVHNWTTRGIPAAAAKEVAAAIKWSTDQVLGTPGRPSAWPFETLSPERWERLTPRQQAMVELAALHEVERIEAATKHVANSH